MQAMNGEDPRRTPPQGAQGGPGAGAAAGSGGAADPGPRVLPPPQPRYAPPPQPVQYAPPHPVQYLPPQPAPAFAPPAAAAPAPPHGAFARTVDRVLSVQRPAVLAHLRGVRLRHPDATAPELVRILELRYLALVTTAGASIGATAVVPAIGTGVTLALSGAETLGFVEATALFAQSVAEVHGITVDDPDRARALVMALMLGKEATGLIAQLRRQAAGRSTRSAYWGELVTSSLPRAVVGPIADQLKTRFVHAFAKRGGASFLGKALPFGVGAAVGGVGNHVLGRRVVAASRDAFGPAPLPVPAVVEPRSGAVSIERRAIGAARRALPGRRRGRAADLTAGPIGAGAAGSGATARAPLDAGIEPPATRY